MDTPSKYAMFTVPHSGTRYIADSFELAGVPTAQCMPRGEAERTTCGPNGLMWAHWMVYGKNPYKYANMPPEQCFAVVRDPIATFATHGKFCINEELSEHMKYSACEDKKIHLQQQYAYQDRYADRVSYYHRVEDPLDGLAEWAGVELQTGAPSHSVPTSLRQAVKDRDIDRIKKLTAGTDYWDWFVNDLTPRIQERYEALGYDLWWTNG